MISLDECILGRVQECVRVHSSPRGGLPRQPGDDQPAAGDCTQRRTDEQEQGGCRKGS